MNSKAVLDLQWDFISKQNNKNGNYPQSLGRVAHAFNFSTWEAETVGSL